MLVFPQTRAVPTTAWLRRAVDAHPAARAYTFLGDGEAETDALTYGELGRQVDALAARLVADGRAGQPVLLVFPAGLEFIVALLACLEAGAVAVPVAVPRARRDEPVLRQLAAETGATIILSTPPLRERLSGSAAALAWRDVTTAAPAEAYASAALPVALAPPPDSDSPAILQYTSGSTGAPKGVVITHRNLEANERSIAEVMGHRPGLIGVGWLPHFHDMGLVGNLLQTLAMGGHLVLMPPAALVQSPLRWLRAIDRYRATTSGGPNFAYDLCVQKITAEQRAGLDLSCWEVAFVGAEPVHAATLERFASAFAATGFRATAWLPCYGLAEATLMVTGQRGLRTTIVDGEALQAGRWTPCPPTHPRARPVVSCGEAAPGVEIVLRSPATGQKAMPGEVGEVMVTGSGVAAGYWRNAAATAERFNQSVEGCAGRFLATGDLGVVTEAGLHVLGRSREMIIVRGQNHFPEDLEFTVQAAAPAIMPGGVAVFGIESSRGEAVVVAAEVQRGALGTLDLGQTARAIAAAVADAHGVTPHEVVLVRPARLSRTTSGKVQRATNRAAYVNGTLDLLYRMQPGTVPPAPTADPAKLTREQLLAAPAARRSRLVVARLKAHVAKLSGCDPLELEATQNLLEMGLDSVQLLEIKLGLDEIAGQDVPIDAFLDAGSLAGLADRVLALGGLVEPGQPASAVDRGQRKLHEPAEAGEPPAVQPNASPVAPLPPEMPVIIASAPQPPAGRCPVAHGFDTATAAPVLRPAPTGRQAPGPEPAEVQADMAQLSRDFPGYLLELTRRHGELVRLVLGHQELHLLTQPDDIGAVFMSEATATGEDVWQRRGVWAPFRAVMGPRGLITSEGAPWKAERTFANSEFNRAAVAADTATVQATTTRALAGWPQQQPLSLLHATKRLTLEIILEKLFGGIVTDPEREELYTAVHDIDRLWNVPAFFLYAGRGTRLAEEHERELTRRIGVIDQAMERWISRVLANPADARGVMAHYARAGAEAPVTELRDVAVTYLLTGFDTTASGLYWAITLLLEHPEALGRLRAESDGTDAARPWTMAVVQEALRLYPPVWYMGREATVDTTLRGYTIPAGSFALASPYVVHRNPWCWPEPLAFKPDRFMPGAPAVSPKAYVPFGVGARRCIGMHFALMEISAAVAHLFRHFDVAVVSGEWRGLCSDFTLTPRSPLEVRVTARR